VVKPSIIIHPGFPKCATSAIQRAFVWKNHALAKELGIEFIGESFIGNDGYPDVLKLIDDPDTWLREFEATPFEPGRYFLSNEAMFHVLPQLDFLERKFDIEAWAITVRTPFLQAVSNYRYSGWSRALLDNHASEADLLFSGAAARQLGKVRRLKKQGAPVRLVALEGAQNGVVAAFCEVAFGETPESVKRLSRSPQGSANPSIGFAFAERLGRGIREIVFGETPKSGNRICEGPEESVNPSIGFAFAERLGRRIHETVGFDLSTSARRGLVKAAQEYDLPNRLQRLAPAGFAEQFHAQRDAAVDCYEELLKESDTDLDMDRTLAHAALKVDELFAMEPADVAAVDELNRHADQVVEMVLGRTANDPDEYADSGLEDLGMT
jgi:hypothetical protein